MLHVGNPGPGGTQNLAQKPSSAGAIARKAITVGAPGNHPTNNERRCLTTVAIEWSGAEIDQGQQITHISVWDALTSGDPKYIHALATPKTTDAGGVVIDAGDLEFAFTVFAKPAE